MKKREHPKVEEEYKHHMDIYHPPLIPMPDIPMCLHYGTFLVKRRFDVHTGVDLYAPVGADVYAIEDSDVVSIRAFTGTEAECPHWNETWCVDLEGYSGIFSYGEIKADPNLKVGDQVKKGQIIGQVLQVLKKDKGKAMSMLHFAIHSHGWKYLVKDQGDPKQEHFFDMQLDPTLLLMQLKAKADLMTVHYKLDGMIMEGQIKFDEHEHSPICGKVTNPYKHYNIFGEEK